MDNSAISSIFLKYKQILLPLIMVLLLDVLLLGINYYLAAQLDQAATNINLAGRQRMLSQKATKSLALLHINTLREAHHDVTQNKNELSAAISLFDRTLSAFSYGGETVDASGHDIVIAPLTDIDSQVLVEALAIWLPLKQQITTIASSETVSIIDIDNALSALSQHNLELLRLMNDLTNQLEQDAEKKTQFLRHIQTVVLLLIFLSFFTASKRLYRKETYYDKLMEKATDLIISVDVKTALTTFVSSSVKDMLGYEEENFLHKPFHLFFTPVSANKFRQLIVAVADTQSLPFDRVELDMLKKNGNVLVTDLVLQLTYNEDQSRLELSANIRDVSERKKAETALAELAHKDVLTGLANRTLFYELTDRAIARAKRYNTKLAILFLDLDDFKAINDDFGHQVGDDVLTQVAQRLTANVRESDTVCRLGGDEFVVLLDNVTNKTKVQNTADKIVEDISVSFLAQGFDCQIGVSIGISIYPDDGHNLDTLLRKADTAMYDVKKTGKNAIAYASR